MATQIQMISFKEIETEMRKFNPDFSYLSVKEIAKNPGFYKLAMTCLDDHFTVLVRSRSKTAIENAKRYLKKEGFLVYGNLDLHGYEISKESLRKKNTPENVIYEVMNKVASYLSLDLNKEEDIGKNSQGDYYFYFYPVTKKTPTWLDFKKGIYLDELNRFAKETRQSIDLIFSQLDNVLYGGLKLPGIACEKFKEAYFEAVNLQIEKDDPRKLFIACKLLMELVPEEKNLDEIGLLQMFFTEHPVFAEDKIEDIYLDFPNEVTEDSL